MSVTGASYTKTRTRGLAPWRPRDKTLVLLDDARAVLEEYADHLPLTARRASAGCLASSFRALQHRKGPHND